MAPKKSLPLSVCVAYSAPYIITTWLASPIGLIQGIYAKYYGLPLTTIAVILLLAKLFDAISDPLIGFYNDRYYQRARTRKPFILAGGLLCLFCSYFLYVPTDISTLEGLSTVGAGYFMAWFLLFFLAWTLFEIPHMAWSNELAPNADDKSKLFSVRTTAYITGVLLFYLVPLLPIFDSKDITPDTLRVSVIASSILMLFLLYYCLKYAPNHYTVSAENHAEHGDKASNPSGAEKSNKQADVESGGLGPFLRSLRSNKPYLLLNAAFLLELFSTGIFYGVFFIYVDAYLNLGYYYAQAAIVGLAASLVSIPLWHKLAILCGKIHSWLLSMLLIIAGFVTIGTFQPGETGFYGLVAVMVLLNAGFACMWIMASGILSEVIDYSRWKYRLEKTASYFSVYTFISKAGHAVANALGLGIAGWYGLDVAATTHDAQSVWGLRLVMTWIPLGFAVLAIVFIALSPITARRHAVVRRRLDNTVSANSF